MDIIINTLAYASIILMFVGGLVIQAKVEAQ